MDIKTTQQAQLEEVLQEIAFELSASNSHAFFEKLVESLARTLDCDYAFIGALEKQAPEPTIKSVAVYARGRPAENFSYALADTPCEHVFGKQVCSHASGVQMLFPEDRLLVDMQVDSYIGAPLFSTDGAPIGIIVVLDTGPMNDTDQKEELLKVYTLRAARELERMATDEALSAYRSDLEERVSRRTAELQRANEEMEAFSYSVSHDLRAPLRTIDGFIHAMREDCCDQMDAQASSYLDRIDAASKRMAALIDDILVLTRVSREDMRCDSVDLTRLASDIAKDIQQSMPRTDASIVIEPALEAIGDSNLLQIALVNLIGNAWKYSRDTPHARIEFGSTRLNGDTVFHIRDNGSGFDMQYADKLFSAFERLHGGDYPGTGVGLATVKRVINRHEGEVWAEARDGAGACFYFTLWAKKPGNENPE